MLGIYKNICWRDLSRKAGQNPKQHWPRRQVLAKYPVKVYGLGFRGLSNLAPKKDRGHRHDLHFYRSYFLQLALLLLRTCYAFRLLPESRQQLKIEAHQKPISFLE